MTNLPRAKSTVSLADWLRLSRQAVVVPSWACSIFFHAALAALLIFLAQLPSCQRDIAGDGGESFREVGIRLKPAAVTDNQIESQDTTEADSHSMNNAVSAIDLPPIPLSLPTLPEMPSVIGAGQIPEAPASVEHSLVQPLAPGIGSPSGGRISGGTSFLGIEDVGKRFVYVLDHSGSMEENQALQAAKTELLASLARLDESQQFQVIFYNNEYVVLQPRGERFDLFWGTDAQRLQVSEQIRAIKPEGGTRHLPAILKALEYRPDVIFLLTDGAAESALSRKDLQQIRRHNHGTRIHCIEFGRGSRSPWGEAGNFLKQLASENDGRYTYRNISSFRD